MWLELSNMHFRALPHIDALQAGTNPDRGSREILEFLSRAPSSSLRARVMYQHFYCYSCPPRTRWWENAILATNLKQNGTVKRRELRTKSVRSPCCGEAEELALALPRRAAPAQLRVLSEFSALPTW